MASVIKSVSFDAADALALAGFWAAVFGSDVDEDSTTDKAFVEAAGWGGPNIWFTRVPEPKPAKNRMHFDLRAPATVAAEVSRLEKLGATVVRNYPRLTVMQDQRATNSASNLAPVNSIVISAGLVRPVSGMSGKPANPGAQPAETGRPGGKGQSPVVPARGSRSVRK